VILSDGIVFAYMCVSSSQGTQIDTLPSALLLTDPMTFYGDTLCAALHSHPQLQNETEIDSAIKAEQ
jgi:hypothetical protein